MDIQFNCSHCGRELTARASQAGLDMSCPCGQAVRVPPWRAQPEPLRLTRPGAAAGRQRLTPLAWGFLLAMAVAGLAAGFATSGIEVGPSRKFVRGIVVGGAVLIVVAVAALCRALGAQFYRHDE